MAGRKTKAAAAATSPANVGVKRTTTARTSATTAPKPSKVTKKPAKKATTTKAAAAKVAKAAKASAAKPAPKKPVKKPAPKKSKVASKPAPEEDAEMEEEEDVEIATSDKDETPAPKPAVSRKRSRTQESEALPVAKKLKVGPSINTPPTQRLDVYVFGAGENNELGLGAAKMDGKPPMNVKRPRYNPLLKGVTQVAVGGMHCIALTDDQRILTWGVSDGGSLGRDTSSYEAPAKDMDADSEDENEDDVVLNPVESTPTAISTDFLDGRKVVQVIASDSASFVLTEDGYVYGWGSFIGNDGIIGFTAEGASMAAKERDGDLKKKLQIQIEPILIPGLKNIKSLARGGNHVMALDNKGTVFTWGACEQNQLGRRVNNRFKFAALTPTPVLKKCKSIAGGTYHSFAINAKGQVLAWGLNNFGQTGIGSNAGEDGATINNPTVVKSFEGFDIKQIKGCLHHSIACTEKQEVLVVGRCDEGQTGLDFASVDQDTLIVSPTTSKPAVLKVPTVVPSVKATFVAGAIDNNIVLTEDGKVWAWGYGENYRTGLGSDDTTRTPTLVENSAIKGKKITFAGCGGQFGVLAGPEVTTSSDN
ncbi:uncharacterized protein EAF01_007785 [Botrytis porri]|uniref:uncharacterized protein n=1 Tax=Botrytis porri TaxID=87229 RepID=UPI0018FFF490|nr:uncharacterized protein EAF01_007785 [Botrytis porri]KAF7900483.1 hypothetical protein EAF01_007785 [Botrytis porri]